MEKTEEKKASRDYKYMHALPMVSFPDKDKVSVSCPQIAWLVYSNGLTRCIFSNSLESHIPTLSTLLCVMPQVHEHNGKEERTHTGLGSKLMKVKWASVLVPILVGTRTVSANAIGTSTLIVGNQYFRELSSQMDLG